ncbi:energy transducer TonB [Ferrimonas lipolytica]|uniref:Protein TonB n=1 Tax=Ferrimonas lipolytica TaxID=2724191 RepID=A0A6H1UHW0_9GAMM|nr:energy transducer TonB [Ferrimonas lipolytica]QIZ78671.1 energy transducer TonB [Ferrimonas lipolytica]
MTALLRLLIAIAVSWVLVYWLPTYLNQRQRLTITDTTTVVPMIIPAPEQRPDSSKPAPQKMAPKQPQIRSVATSVAHNNPATVAITLSPLQLAPPQMSNIELAPLANQFASLSEVDQAPKLLRYIAPKMPVAARSKGINGKVMLRLVVAANGDVLQAEVLSAQPEQLFEQAALTAAKQWQFKPAQINQQAVAVYLDVPLNFQLN